MPAITASRKFNGSRSQVTGCFGAASHILIVRLPVKVEGPPTMDTCLVKLGDRNSITGHNQYYMVLLYVFRVVKVSITKEEEPKITLCGNLSSDLEG